MIKTLTSEKMPYIIGMLIGYFHEIEWHLFVDGLVYQIFKTIVSVTVAWFFLRKIKKRYKNK